MGKAELRIEIDADLLARAQAAGLRIAAMTEASLRRELKMLEQYQGLSDDQKAARWAEENAEAIEAQAERIETYGVFGEDLRTW